MKRCKTCKHWLIDKMFSESSALHDEPPHDWIVGDCQKLKTQSKLFDFDCDEGGRHEFSVSQNFGCIEHSEGQP